ncbi:MAG: response regulator transcription factor [Dermatophilaceae bacterium]
MLTGGAAASIVAARRPIPARGDTHLGAGRLGAGRFGAGHLEVGQLDQALTDRERDVVRAVATGATNAEVAALLFISENTVKTHLARILTKLDLRDRVQLVALAYRSGFLD